MNLLKDATLAVEPRLGVPYSGFLSREKTFVNFMCLGQFVEVFSAKIYFQAIRYRASERGGIPVITNIKATVEKATLGSGGDGGDRTGSTCGGCG